MHGMDVQRSETGRSQHYDVLRRADGRLSDRSELQLLLRVSRTSESPDNVCLIFELVDLGRDASPAVRVGCAQQDGTEAANPDAGAGEALRYAARAAGGSKTPAVAGPDLLHQHVAGNGAYAVHIDYTRMSLGFPLTT